MFVSQPLTCFSLEGLGDDVRAHAKASRRLMFTTQTGAKFDLKEDQLENVFSKHGKVVKYKIFKKSNMGFDGFVGKWLTLLTLV